MGETNDSQQVSPYWMQSVADYSKSGEYQLFLKIKEWKLLDAEKLWE
jgi:hypothetical protein